MMEIRTTPEFSTVTENKLEGYAIVFNRTSNVLYDKASRKFFTETILPEAVDYDTISRSDILMLINHNKERMLARSRFGEGSLKLEIDDLGVRFSFDIPKTSDGDYIREMVSRGDFSGCSFAFTDEDVELSYDKENHCAHRIVRKIRQLYDTSIVINPAYSATEVAIRQVEEIVDQNERVIEEVTEERSVEKHPSDVSTLVEEVKVEETITPDDTWKEQLREYKTRLNNL